jgi:NSS family neurotransmitter:Na+ symporter
METAKRENWGSSVGFILAVAGSAIGLGNIWKFPYMTGMNGGGIFVLAFAGVLLIGMGGLLLQKKREENA